MSLPENGVLADIGCGNGKYFGVRKDMTILGSDRSFGLASQASQRCSRNVTSQSQSQISNLRREALGNSVIQNRRSSLKTREEEIMNVRKTENATENTRQNGVEGSTMPFVSPIISQQLNFHSDVLVADGLHLPYKVKSYSLRKVEKFSIIGVWITS